MYPFLIINTSLFGNLIFSPYLCNVRKLKAMYIKSNKGREIGDWVKTTKRHASMAGRFTVGTKVQIIGIDPMRGYAIQDEFGNRMIEIGWEI